jgi:hypothetical protein
MKYTSDAKRPTPNLNFLCSRAPVTRDSVGSSLELKSYEITDLLPNPGSPPSPKALVIREPKGSFHEICSQRNLPVATVATVPMSLRANVTQHSPILPVPLYSIDTFNHTVIADSEKAQMFLKDPDRFEVLRLVCESHLLDGWPLMLDSPVESWSPVDSPIQANEEIPVYKSEVSSKKPPIPKYMLSKEEKKEIQETVLSKKRFLGEVFDAKGRLFSRRELRSICNQNRMRIALVANGYSEKEAESISQKKFDTRRKHKSDKARSRRARSKDRSCLRSEAREICVDTLPDEKYEPAESKKKKRCRRSHAKTQSSNDVSWDQQRLAFRQEFYGENDTPCYCQGAFTESWNMSNVLTNKFSHFVGYDNLKFIEWIYDFVDMIAFILNSTNSPSQKSRYFRLWLRLQGFGVIESVITSTGFNIVLNQFATPKDDVCKTQSGIVISEELDKFGDILEYTFDSSFADAVKNLFISAALMHWFHKDTAGAIFKYLGSFPTKMPFYDLMRLAIKSLAKVVKVFEDIASGMHLCEALFKKDSWVHACKMHQTLMMQKEHLYMGLKVEGKFPKTIWLKDVDETLTYLQGKQKVTSMLKGKQYMVLTTMITELTAAKMDVIIA